MSGLGNLKDMDTIQSVRRIGVSLMIIADFQRRSGQTSGDITWTRIWKLAVPPKVRIFWWRVVIGFLPTKEVLHRRHVEPIANCEVCGAEEESIKHALLDCTVAKSFWEQIKLLTGVKVPLLHPLTWARDLVDPGVINPKNAAQLSYVVHGRCG